MSPVENTPLYTVGIASSPGQAKTPLKRFAGPQEIAQTIVYLVADAASYVTGSELVVNGGFTA